VVIKSLLSGAKQQESHWKKRNILSKTLRKTQKQWYFHYFIISLIASRFQSMLCRGVLQTPFTKPTPSFVHHSIPPLGEVRRRLLSIPNKLKIKNLQISNKVTTFVTPNKTQKTHRPITLAASPPSGLSAIAE